MKQPDTNSYLSRFQKQLFKLIFKAITIQRFNPVYIFFWLKVYYAQKKGNQLRRKLTNKKTAIPAVMVLSTTNRCNLQCKGCYANAQERNLNNELSAGRISQLFSEAEDIGTRIIMLAGGEPLMRKEILDMASQHKNIVFPVFTNGLMIKEEMLTFFKKNKNIFPILSIEGDKHLTDLRRGEGLYNKVLETAKKLYRNKCFYGISITLTTHNYEKVTNSFFLKQLINNGCRLFFFIEYVPSSQQDVEKCLNDEQKEDLKIRVPSFRKRLPGLFISLPGDEDQYGGCLAGGRGFIHVSSTGQLEPCPFAPYYDVNIKDMELIDALKSDFLLKIREEHHMLKESIGGCSLWENKDWVEKQLAKEIA